jgi:hypothetical protein
VFHLGQAFAEQQSLNWVTVGKAVQGGHFKQVRTCALDFCFTSLQSYHQSDSTYDQPRGLIFCSTVPSM